MFVRARCKIARTPSLPTSPLFRIDRPCSSVTEALLAGSKDACWITEIRRSTRGILSTFLSFFAFEWYASCEKSHGSVSERRELRWGEKRDVLNERSNTAIRIQFEGFLLPGFKHVKPRHAFCSIYLRALYRAVEDSKRDQITGCLSISREAS